MATLIARGNVVMKLKIEGFSTTCDQDFCPSILFLQNQVRKCTQSQKFQTGTPRVVLLRTQTKREHIAAAIVDLESFLISQIKKTR